MATAVKVGKEKLKEMEKKHQALQNKYLELVKEVDDVYMHLNSKSDKVLA